MNSDEANSIPLDPWNDVMTRQRNKNNITHFLCNSLFSTLSGVTHVLVCIHLYQEHGGTKSFLLFTLSALSILGIFVVYVHFICTCCTG